MTYVFTGTCACGAAHEKRVLEIAAIVPDGIDFILIDCACGRQVVLVLDALSRWLRAFKANQVLASHPPPH